MMACDIPICAVDTNSEIFVCFQCWFVKETYTYTNTSRCHFQSVKVTPVGKTNTYKDFFQIFQRFLSQIFSLWNSYVMCWLEADFATRMWD